MIGCTAGAGVAMTQKRKHVRFWGESWGCLLSKAAVALSIDSLLLPLCHSALSPPLNHLPWPIQVARLRPGPWVERFSAGLAGAPPLESLDLDGALARARLARVHYAHLEVRAGEERERVRGGG